MRLFKDLEFDNMSCYEVVGRLRKINEYNNDNNLAELNVLIEKLKKHEKMRYLMMWYYGSSISAHHLLLMISC